MAETAAPDRPHDFLAIDALLSDEGYGCAGASATAYGLVCLELDAGDSGVRSLVSRRWRSRSTGPCSWHCTSGE
jgi:hypothetical protein